ncbi:MAG: hypothetical protein JWL88_819, partial [Parcubacteria group bacterium]|nr:hypothetical protein [Parcubacteria group bacterium]
MKSRKRIFVGTIALLALLILPAASHAAITRPLTTGSSGNDVLELQETLRTKGYFT